MNYKELFGESWAGILEEYLELGKLNVIAKKVNIDRNQFQIIPEQGSPLFFKAFRETLYNEVKVVILGQDPYHSPPNAFDGLAFSNSFLDSQQPSLKNILAEVERDIYDGFELERLSRQSLYSWAEQGVLLINVAHSVRAKKPGSHLPLWEPFTLEVIKALNKKDDLIWLLWGNYAISYKEYISNKSHYIICTSHPSSYSYMKPVKQYPPFWKSNCFSQVNEQLEARNLSRIKW